MQAMVAKAGFEMTITTYDLSTWITNFESGHYDTTLFQSLGEPDPSGNVDYQFLSNGYQDITGLKSNKVDALLTQALSVTATSARTALYKQALQLIRDSYQWIFLFNPAVNLAARTNIVGYSLNPFGNVNLSYAGFKS